ncbi:hypothetical protein PO909_011248 [Leuciscus waleckii]
MIGLLLQLDGIPYFRCSPPGSGIAVSTGTVDITATAPSGHIENGGGEHGPLRLNISRLPRDLVEAPPEMSVVPEPKLEVIPTISSRYLSTSSTISGSFPASEVTFHVPRASFRVQGSGCRGPRLRSPPDPLSTGPLRFLLQVVSPREGGPTSFGLSPAGPHEGRPGH